jgi:DNA polymerase (family X)
MTNEEAAHLLEEYADLNDLVGVSAFRVNAYRRAAASIRAETRPLAELRAAGDLRRLPGVGPAIEAKLVELVDTGSFHQYDELREQFPPGLTDLLEVPGIGVKTAMRLFRERGIADLAGLEAAARAGQLREVAGFGERSEQRVLEGIALLRQRGQRLALGTALPLAEGLLAALRRACPAIVRADLGGSLRRMQETIGDIDLLCACPEPTVALDAFAALPRVERVLWRGDVKCTVVLHGGLQVDLMALPPERYGSLLQHFTGGKAHNVHLRTLALARGISLSEHGLLRGDRLQLVAEEAEIYAALDMDWMPPELREDQGELAAAAAHRLPRLIAVDDLRGDLHSHTTWSDGAADIETMARAALAAGHAYLAITDHSAGLPIARGLDAARLRQQRAEIDAVQARLPGIRLLQGCEVEIRADGSLDLDDATLADLDLVIASPHVALGQPRAAYTARLLRAIQHPLVDIIGHPNGRIINQRAPAEVDLDAVIAAAAASGTVLEVNADPARLDLSDRHIRAAVAAGVTLGINSDAHHPDGFGVRRHGVAQARRGWATPTDVLNTLPLAEMLARLKRRRHRP